MKQDAGIKIIAKNRKAFFDYAIEEKLEAGLCLQGSEVKSLRDGKANLMDAFAIIKGGEIFLLHAHISPYGPSAQFNHAPTRTRKLLLHKTEISKLEQKLSQKGFTLIPLLIYFKKGRAKVELGLGKGKKHFDKRESIKKRESDRSISRAMRRR
jgi:SsrA-binding protein